MPDREIGVGEVERIGMSMVLAAPIGLVLLGLAVLVLVVGLVRLATGRPHGGALIVAGVVAVGALFVAAFVA